MNVNAKHYDAPKAAPVIIEHVFAEKPGGGLVANQSFDVPQGCAVYADGTKFKPIKAYKLVAAVATSDSTIKVAKGSGVAVGDAIGHKKKSVAVTEIDASNPDYDLVTVSLGVEVAKGAVLYEAASVSASAAAPKGTPVYVTGNEIPANSGDFPVRLINGANLRKETAPIAAEVSALIPTINLV